MPYLAKRILLAEDDEQVLEAARTILVRAGYCVVAARTAREAMEVVSLFPVDLLVSDIVLPGGTGFDIAAAATQARPGIPVVLMSAFAASDFVLEGAAFSLRGYLRKPFQPRELVATVQAVSHPGGSAPVWSGVVFPARSATAFGTIRSLLRLIGMRDAYTLSHSRRVRRLAVRLARAMDMPEPFLREVALAGWFHDVGMIHVPLGILTKPGPLLPEEHRLVRSHTDVGAAILRSLHVAPSIVEAVRHHHERFDGARTGPFPGYPSGLAGEQIPLLARVVAIADVYDAITTPRVYRLGLSPAAALTEVEQLAGSQFDPDLAKAFVQVMRAERGVHW